MGAALAQDVEVWEARDVALVRCDVNGVTPLNTWLTHRVQVLTDLSSFGYPHAITWSPSGEQLNVLFRAYKGHVITTRGFDRLPGPPAVYEMSCAFPVGMSGAPLLIANDEVLAVAGVVLGVDTVKYGGVEQSVGIALMAEDIVHLESKLAGGPIASSLRIRRRSHSNTFRRMDRISPGQIKTAGIVLMAVGLAIIRRPGPSFRRIASCTLSFRPRLPK